MSLLQLHPSLNQHHESLDQPQRRPEPGISLTHELVLVGNDLQATKRLSDVLRLDRGATLLRHLKQRAQLPLPLLRLASRRGRARRPRIIQVLRGLDLERLLRDGLDDLEGQEAEDVDDVVVGLAVGDDAEAGPLAEALALAEGEGGLAAVGPVDVLVARHVLGAFVG